MNANCDTYTEWIQRSIFEDIDPERREALEAHLAVCPDCAAEKALLLSTLSEMRAFPEMSTPKHFYVQPERRRATLWNIFQQMSLFARLATASFLLGALLIGGAAASSLQVHSEDGVLSLGFGKFSTQPKIDPEALRASLTRELQVAMDQRQELLLDQLRLEISNAADSLNDQQRQRLNAALGKLEERFDQRIDQQTMETRARFQAAAQQIYTTLSREQKRQIALLNDRLDLLNVRDQIQGNQTQALMATVLQIADLNSTPLR